MNPQEFYVAKLLEDNQFFETHKDKIRPQVQVQDKLRSILEILVQHGNSLPEIYKRDPKLCAYAIGLMNRFAQHQIMNSKKT